jgi:hypothetical protein
MFFNRRSQAGGAEAITCRTGNRADARQVVTPTLVLARSGTAEELRAATFAALNAARTVRTLRGRGHGMTYLAAKSIR